MKILDLQEHFGLAEHIHLMPVLVIVPVSAVLLVAISLLTPPPRPALVERFFPEHNGMEKIAVPPSAAIK